jgi:hypothetical protein
MKLLLENWRKYIKEEEQASLLGATVNFQPNYGLKMVLIDLVYIKDQLQQSQNIDEFLEKLTNKEIHDKAIVGYISCTYIPLLAKGVGLTYVGGRCSDAYMVKRSMAPGRGEELYNALLGFASLKGIYVTSDRRSTSPGAKSRWSKIDQQTDDETPHNTEPYMGKFDDRKDPKTKPRDDDCRVYGMEHLDKGYQDDKQVDFYKELEYNLSTFFEKEIEPLFDEPGFFGRLFGRTPASKADKIKAKLINFGRRSFIDWEIEGKPWPKKK